MKRYLTLSFKDTPQGRKLMGERIEHLSKQGWELKNKETVSKGYSAGKTLALGVIFLPLALLGRKGNKIEVVMEKEISTKELEKEKSQDEFLNSYPQVTTIAKDNSIKCPSCGKKIKDYTVRGIFSKTRVYKCNNCNHTVLK